MPSVFKIVTNGHILEYNLTSLPLKSVLIHAILSVKKIGRRFLGCKYLL